MLVLLFKALGILVLCYVGRSYVRGEVYARNGIWGRPYHRDSEPWRYWFTLVFYSLLAVALFFFFGRL